MVQTRTRAEAAAWLARLRSDERTANDEAGFRAWLAESEAHRQAFDALNTVWEAAGALPRQPRRQPARADRRLVLASGLAAACGLGSVGVWKAAFAGTYATDIGEQRRVALDDGSLIILDTDSKVRVDFEGSRRRVELIRGRAHFEVARDAARPFTVEAAGRRVVALGTAFEVTRDEAKVCVIVTKGEVAVFDPRTSAKQLALPGERVTLGEAAPQVDKPNLARVTAWQQGRAVFDNDTVAAAVAEMNRYSRRPIVIVGDEAAAMQVSGVYSTGDTEAFASSLATLLPLDVDLGADQVTITARNNS
ncbi:MAG TPA: FecR domain-containing protein [Caulobacteraceae bacterium]|nr:FecR domain-containing protein [Caulobacteraceae bacterium]